MKRVVVLGATVPVWRGPQDHGRGFASAESHTRRQQPADAGPPSGGRLPGGQVESAVFDLDDATAHERLLDAAEAALGPADIVFLAHGVLGSRDAAPEEAEAILRTNLGGPTSLLLRAARRMEARRAGTLVALSSVSGDRGRAANPVYGAAKAGLTALLSALRQRLSSAGVSVLTVKPGFVDTPMTAHLPAMPFVVGPDRVARDIVRALERGADVVYTPPIWRLVMLVVRLLPEKLFKKLSF
jgi:NAD(P)-dependent dehydrogenase (short-subunit alcohol dehydrogenase family)